MGVKLQIQLLEARGLPPKDNGGARDAFARLQMGASKARSSTVAKDNDPTWQEEFLFSVSDAEKDELLVTVWDKSVFIGEEFLGQLVLPVRQLTQLNAGPWLFDDGCSGSSTPSSTNLTRSTAHKDYKPPDNPPPPAATSRGGAGEGEEDGTVMHRTVSYMTAPSSLVKSVQATEEQRHVPPLASLPPPTSLSPDQPSTPPPLSSPLARLLSLLGLSPDLLPSKTAIAEAAVRAAGPLALVIFCLAAVLLPVHLVLVARGGAGVAAPLLDLPDSVLELVWCAVILAATKHVVAMARGLLVSKYIKKGDHGKKAVGEGWLLTVSLVEGENVGDSGLVVKTDPFVVFTCSGKSRTSSVKLQTNMPKWNEVLEFDAFEDAPSILEIEIFNYDGPFSEPSLLGRAEINFLRQSVQDLADLWVPLEGRRAKVQAARIHVRVLLTNTSDAAGPPLVLEKISKEVGAKGGVREFSAEKNLAFQRLFDLPDSEYLINDFSCILKKGLLSQGRLFLSPRLLAFYSSVFGTRIKFTLLWEDIDEIQENAPSLFDPPSQKEGKSQKTSTALPTSAAQNTSQETSTVQKSSSTQQSSMTTFKRLLNPAVTVYVKKDKGAVETRAAAHGVDSAGRLKIRFQSFVRPSMAFRLVIALWRNRNLPTDQRLARAKEEGERVGNVGVGDGLGAGGRGEDRGGARGGGQGVSDSRRGSVGMEDGGGSFVGVEMREVIDEQRVGVPITVGQFLGTFEDPAATAGMMEKAGQMGAEISEWVDVPVAESVPVQGGEETGQQGSRTGGGGLPSVIRRQRSIKYRFSRQVPPLSPTVTAVQQMTQQCSNSSQGDGQGGCQWACLEQVLTLQKVPFGDCFQVEILQEIQGKESFTPPPAAAGAAAGGAAGENSAGGVVSIAAAAAGSAAADAASSAAGAATAVASALVAAAGALKLKGRGVGGSSMAAGDRGGDGERGTAGAGAAAVAGAAAGGGGIGAVTAGGLQEAVLRDERVRSVLHVRVVIVWHKELSEATRAKIKSSIGRFYKQQARRVVDLMAAQTG
ncbi:hypothetical protein CLOM_g2144 [Closterium sp. NIES-68]|nr:hypothetical protein CLOM_g2144 [Closterium sp. NIES-68]